MSDRQFVAVKVPDKSGDGWSRVIVESVSWANPTFPTKGILGLADEPAPAATDGELPL